eukprot:g8095.t1
MRRRGIGLGRTGIIGGSNSKRKPINDRFKALGKKIEDQHIDHIQEQMSLFKSKLEEFANKHKRSIREDPVFRTQFQRMCSKIGVDPLASNKGVWAKLGVSQFYTELSIQIVDVCLSTRGLNGGLISMDDLIKCINIMKGSNAVELTEDDIERAVSKLAVLKGGFKMLSNGSQKHVLSVPVELNQDHSEILKLVKDQGGWVTPNLIANKLQWKQLRIVKALEDLQREGMFWIDRPDGVETKNQDVQYYIPSIALSKDEM